MRFCVPKRFKVTSDIKYRPEPYSLVYFVSGNGILPELETLGIDWQENRDRVMEGLQKYFFSKLQYAPEMLPLAGMKTDVVFADDKVTDNSASNKRIALGIYSSEDLDDLAAIGFNPIRSMFTGGAARNIAVKSGIIWGNNIFTGDRRPECLADYVTLFTIFEHLYAAINNNHVRKSSGSIDQIELIAVRQTVEETFSKIQKDLSNTRAVRFEKLSLDVHIVGNEDTYIEIVLTLANHPSNLKGITFGVHCVESINNKPKLEFSFDPVSQKIWDNIFCPHLLADYLEYTSNFHAETDEPVLPKTVWTHKNGCQYMVVMLSNTDSQRSEYPTQVTYVGKNGKLWSKDLDNFLSKMTQTEVTPAELNEFISALASSIAQFIQVNQNES